MEERNGFRSMLRAVCEWSEGVAGGKLKYEIGLRHICEMKWSKRNRLSAEGNKTTPVEARSDQQASQTRAAAGFLALAQRNDCMCLKYRESSREEDWGAAKDMTSCEAPGGIWMCFTPLKSSPVKHVQMLGTGFCRRLTRNTIFPGSSLDWDKPI